MKKQFQSIQKEELNKRGFSLIEAILALAVFSLISTFLVGALMYGQEGTFLSGSRGRANFLAEEGLEASRAIRDNNFSNLVDGTYGLAIISNQWEFSGTEDVIDIFTRQIEISSVSDGVKQIVSKISWQQNLQRSGLISLTTYLTQWKDSVETASCAQFCQTLGYSDGTCRQTIRKCGQNGEDYQSEGDLYCTGGAQADTCCCLP